MLIRMISDSRKLIRDSIDEFSHSESNDFWQKICYDQLFL